MKYTHQQLKNAVLSQSYCIDLLGKDFNDMLNESLDYHVNNDEYIETGIKLIKQLHFEKQFKKNFNKLLDE